MAKERQKRYRFASFRDRIDAIKIEPYKKLNRRAFDETDTSHFITCFERWREINKSATFTEFVYAADSLSQSLPLIIHNKEKIFELLKNSLTKHDPLALQPLLELLTQLCHDLGDDFLVFYDDSLKIILELASGGKNSPDELEWEFNCLAYIFKYLSRYISKDLKNTYDLLSPLFYKKTSQSRFVAEAYSFLIKKCSTEQLNEIISYIFKNLDNDEVFNKSIVTLFVESIKSTKGVIHSKSTTILNQLAKNLVIQESFTIFTDTLLEIINFSETDDINQVYELVLEQLDQMTDFKGKLKILTALCFAGSGRKVPDWDALTQQIVKTFQTGDINDNDTSILSVHLSLIFFRNSEINIITKYHSKILNYLMSLGDYFFAFIISLTEVSQEKAITFIPTFLTTFIKNNWENHLDSLSSFINELLEKDLFSQFNIRLPNELEKYIYNNLEGSNYEIYSKLTILEQFKKPDSKVLLSLFNKVLESQDLELKSQVLSKILKLLQVDRKKLVLSNLQLLYSNNDFLNSLISSISSETYNDDEKSLIISQTSENLLSSNRSTRLNTWELLSLLYNSNSKIIEFINQAKIIENLPLTFEYSREMSIRMRSLTTSYTACDNTNQQLNEIYVKFMFGLLTVRFSPAWEGVYESLTETHKGLLELIWKFVFKFLMFPYKKFNEDAENEGKEIEFSDKEHDLYFLDTRLDSMIYNCSKVTNKYTDCKPYVLESLLHSSANSYTFQMKLRVLKILKKLPVIAEKNSDALLPIILGDEEDETDEIYEKSTIIKQDKILIWEIFSSIKKISKISNSKVFFSKAVAQLSSKTPEFCSAALDCVLNFNNPKINKYKDSLKNLLDDMSFRDELSKLITRTDSSIIEDDDKEAVMPLIIRIVFARAQNSTTIASKKGLKRSAISSIANLNDKYLIMFLDMASERLNQGVTVETVSSIYLKTLHGYFTLMSDVIYELGENFSNVLQLITPYAVDSMVLCQKVATAEGMEDNLISLAKVARQSGMKLLYYLFETLHSCDWTDYIEPIFDDIFKPRFENFEDENLQQTSSLMKIFMVWTEHESYHELLLINEFEPVKKVLTLFANPKAKYQVTNQVGQFAINVVKSLPKKQIYQNLLEYLSTTVLNSLSTTLTLKSEKSFIEQSVNLLLLIVERDLLTSKSQIKQLFDILTGLLDKPSMSISFDTRTQVLQTLCGLASNFTGDFSEVENLYKVCSKFLKFIKHKDQRKILVEIFEKLGSQFTEIKRVGGLLVELETYSKKRMEEFDYDRRISAFRTINEDIYLELKDYEWLPILNSCIFFINEIDDLAIRTNATYTIKRFIDSFSTNGFNADSSRLFKDVLLSNLKLGIRNKEETVRTEFINILSYIITDGKHVDEFKDMMVLIDLEDEEKSFFVNITHIQIHRRQKAIRDLASLSSSISSSNIAHYILPIVEVFVYCDDEKLRNLSNDAISTIESLVSCLTFKQYQAIFKRYLSYMKEDHKYLHDVIGLIVTISKSLMNCVNLDQDEDVVMADLPKEKCSELDDFIDSQMIQPISKFLNKRHKEVMVYKTALVEGIACLCKCLTHDRLVLILPGVLTGICQILRTRQDDLRESTRKHLGRASKILGPTYLKFIIQELKTALTRGSQVHILGFTVHYIIILLDLKHGDLDESSGLISEIIMENIFGSIGEEKDSDNYKTTMREVKSNKGFDMAEILGKYISISSFEEVINPIKMLLQERITYKVQNKLDDLIKRYMNGLSKNEEVLTSQGLVLCYQIYQESHDLPQRRRKKVSESEDHFLVKLDAKPQRVEMENSLYIETIQKFSLELLRIILTKNPKLISNKDLKGFLVILKESIKSENESILIPTFKILSIIIDLEFNLDEIEVEFDIFKTAARRCLIIIKNFPSTESELCQAAFKFLSIIMRRREDLTLKENSIGYLLIKILPDIHEQNKQGLAFNFIKSVVSKHVMIPEVYDIMDKVRDVMVTSPSKERRDMSRSIYYQFLMEYDQSRGRLEGQFKFLVNNLDYPSDSGKQSVMELVHLIVLKSGKELIKTVGSSFFVGLAKILISETNEKSREMAVSIIGLIFKKLGTGDFNKYIIGWLNSKNSSLVGCAFQLFRIKKAEDSESNELDGDVLKAIKEILANSKATSLEEVRWELVYNGLQSLLVLLESNFEIIKPQGEKEELKQELISCLLFPHSWVRLSADRICCYLLTKSKDFFSAEELQLLVNRMIHQLRAPQVEEKLASQIVKGLILSVGELEKEQSLMSISKPKSVAKSAANEEDEEDQDEQEEEEEGRKIQVQAGSFVIKKASSILRSQKSSQSSKKACIQLFAMLVQTFSADRVLEEIHDLLLPLILINLDDDYSDRNDPDSGEIQELSKECLKMIENKIGISEYTQQYSNTMRFINNRRQERKNARSVLAITAPDVAARRKNKIHLRAREKRKNLKDENGYYHAKGHKRARR